ncbi:MAG: nucleotide exchange factor GrpE [Proteobacteria bacterium]|nr:nucleotide exchange factor GrpE [Pseudomonadota bacterium]
MASEAENPADKSAHAQDGAHPPIEDQLSSEAPEAPEPPSIEDPADALDQARVEVASLKDQVLRAQAEIENIRRRSRRDVEHAHKFALERFANDLLPVVDSLELAVGSGEVGSDNVMEGVELSLKLFVTTLEKSGLTQIDPLGEPFNPEFHEALAMLANPDAEPNSVMQVMQKGYSLNGRLIRAAKVIVVKAPAT